MKLAFKVSMRFLLPICLSAMSVLSPIVFLQGKNVFELMRMHGVSVVGDAMNPIATAVLFFCSGCVLRAVDAHFWLSRSALAIAVFPILVLAEVIVGLGHHNLFPFEVAIYVILGLPTIAGAALVGAVARGWTKWKLHDS